MPPGPAWLSDAVFYQIYPQSFFDTNADGIGDLPGVIAKLDYVRHLGCNALWINPCFDSPFLDAGYDVRDYYRVAERYGTNADLKRLFREAHKRGIRVCLDLVAGHTSNQHPWFVDSAAHEPSPYDDWYIWTDNWLATPAAPRHGEPLPFVSGYASRSGAYVTNFFWSQPALNYGFAEPDPKHPWQQPTDAPGPQAVRRELLNIICYWLDQGADGFRVDMASSLVKGDRNWRATSEIWRDIRLHLDENYPEAVLISEWSSPNKAIPAGFHIDFIIHCHSPAYTALFRQEKDTNVLPGDGHSFFRRTGRGDITVFMQDYLRHYRATRTQGHIAISTGNHDLPRITFHRSKRELEVAYAFIFTMPGTPFLYYGDEIGMRYFPGQPSVEGGYHRSGARTPMQWDRSPNAGFSRAPAQKLYMPIDPDRRRPTVADQLDKPNSLLNCVRQLIQLRRDYPALGANGQFQPLYAKKNKYPLVYCRKQGAHRLVVAVNPSGETAAVACPAPTRSAAPRKIAGSGAIETATGRLSIKMPPTTYAICEI